MTISDPGAHFPLTVESTTIVRKSVETSRSFTHDGALSGRPRTRVEKDRNYETEHILRKSLPEKESSQLTAQSTTGDCERFFTDAAFASTTGIGI